MKKEQIKPAVKLGKLINKLRKEKDKKEGGYGLRKFAEKIIATDNKGEKKPMTHSNLSHIEHGKVWTTREVLEQIAAKLDYELDEMLAIRKEVGSDIEDIIIDQIDLVPQFLRTAKNLTSEEWGNLIEQVKKIKKDNKND